MTPRGSTLSRRDFVGGALAGAGLLACAGRPPEGSAAPPATFDLHTHPGLFPLRGTPPAAPPAPGYAGDDGVARTVADMRAGGLDGGFFSLVADMKIIAFGPDGVRPARTFEPGEAWADYRRQLGELRALLEQLPADSATTVADLEAARAGGRVAAFVASEGGDCLEGRPERVEEMYRDGVRSIQLVHYVPNELGDLQTADPVHGGLSTAGREVVREMTRLGMVIDVAHASIATVRAVAEVTDAPLVLSHSQLKHGDHQHPRLLDPEHARAVAATGGVIGMWPSGFGNATFADFVENTLRMVDVVGVDHVGLGTDMDGNFRPVFDTYRQLPDWTAALRARGLSEADVAKLAGGNAVWVLRRVLG